MTKTLLTLAGRLCLALSASLALAETSDVAKILKDAATEVSYLSFDQALPIFGEAQRLAAEGSEQWQTAVFGRAICLQQIAPVTADRLGQSTSLYTSLIERFPQGTYTQQCLMALGRIEELVDYLGDQPRRPEARTWYEKARDTAPVNAPISHEAMLRIASTYVQSYEPKQCQMAMTILEDWLKKYPDNPLASAMWQYSGDTWFWPLGDEKKAVNCYLKADELGLLEKGREGPTYWRMAVLAERNDLRETAIAYYSKVITKTPTSGKAFEAQLALKRMGVPVPSIDLFERRENQATTQPADPAKLMERS